MKRIVVSLALTVVFACCACMPVAAADNASNWTRADGPYTQPGTEEAVSGRLILGGGQTKTAAETLAEVQPLVGDDLEQEVYRDGAPLAETDIVSTGDTVRSASSAEPLGIVVRGDVTGTGAPGLRQVIQVAKAVRGEVQLEGSQAEAADVNGSGALDLGDVVLAARYMINPSDAAAQSASGQSATGAKRTTTGAKTTTSTPSVKPETTQDKFSHTVLEGTNKLRADNGVKPALKQSKKLSEAAQVRAEEMASAGKLSHTRPDGSKYSTVCTVAKGLVVGENIHCNKGYSLDETAKVAQKGWENSAPHRKQMLEPRYSHIGLGFAQAKDGTWYCVQLFSNGDDVVSIDSPKA